MTDPRDAGAHYYRADFQVHTPRDTNWKGARATSEEERQAYGLEFVAACRTKHLHAVAITDHHDFVLVPYIRDAAQAELGENGQALDPADRLVVFPGLELTLAVPCQALLILDADFPDDKLSGVLEALSIEQCDPTEEKLPNVIKLEHVKELAKLYELLDLKPWLRNRYIVFPNVTDGGYQTLMRSGMGTEYKSMPCVGGYLDGTVGKKAKTGSGNRNIFDGLDANYGNKRLALFQTSDCRNRNFDDLGKNSTWVKWSIPTAEALRQACLAQESRISQVQPALPSVHIARIHVSNSSFLGPIDLDLNPQLNAIIGGRGTGKSTILDYLRWCLGDTPVAGVEDDELPGTIRQRKLIEATLASIDATVEVTVVINGITHVVRRKAMTGEFSLKVGSEEFEPATERSIQSLLPVHAYSQKQLSSVSVRLDELTRFVTAPIRHDLDAKDRQIVAVSDHLRQNYASLQRARSIKQAIERNELDIKSLTDQAGHIRSSLAGLSPEDQQVLDDRPRVDTSRRTVKRWLGIPVQVEEATTSALDALDSIDALHGGLPAGMPDGLSEPIRGIHGTGLEALRELRAAIALALVAYKEASAPLSPEGDLAAALEHRLAELDVLYAAVKKRSSSHREQLDQLSAIEERRTLLSDELAKEQQEIGSLGDPDAQQLALRRELMTLTADRSALLSAQCAAVTKLSQGLLDAQIVRGRGFGDVRARFTALSAGSNIRASKRDALFDGLAGESNPLETWEAVLTELEQLLLVPEGTDFTSELSPTLTRLGIGLADQQRLRARMSVDAWLDLTLTPIRDEPLFRYQTGELEFIPFASASAGQQATALLRVLLSQSGMPLIIDQPEDDLDSQVVQDVVTWLWESKSKRQIVIASHNANLVVNGDAELVIVCANRRSGDQSGGKISLQGAIDMPEVRAEITRVMEGGEKAFKLRKDKYGF